MSHEDYLEDSEAFYLPKGFKECNAIETMIAHKDCNRSYDEIYTEEGVFRAVICHEHCLVILFDFYKFRGSL